MKPMLTKMLCREMVFRSDLRKMTVLLVTQIDHVMIEGNVKCKWQPCLMIIQLHMILINHCDTYLYYKLKYF